MLSILGRRTRLVTMKRNTEVPQNRVFYTDIALRSAQFVSEGKADLREWCVGSNKYQQISVNNAHL